VGKESLLQSVEKITICIIFTENTVMCYVYDAMSEVLKPQQDKIRKIESLKIQLWWACVTCGAVSGAFIGHLMYCHS
jgi:hypothetical protein